MVTVLGLKVIEETRFYTVCGAYRLCFLRRRQTILGGLSYPSRGLGYRQFISYNIIKVPSLQRR